MHSADTATEQALAPGPCKRIRVVLPNDGTDRTLIETLWHEKGITRADSVAVRGVAALQEAKTKWGRLPESIQLKLVTVIVTVDEADALFDFIFEAAQIDRPGGGLMIMDGLRGATPFRLREDVPEEGE